MTSSSLCSRFCYLLITSGHCIVWKGANADKDDEVLAKTIARLLGVCMMFVNVMSSIRLMLSLLMKAMNLSHS